MEVFRFLCKPGDAEAVLLCFCGGWNRSLDRPGLDLARVTELADQVLLLLLAFLLLFTYASAACMYRDVPLGALYEPLSPPLLNPLSLLEDRVLVSSGRVVFRFTAVDRLPLF